MKVNFQQELINQGYTFDDQVYSKKDANGFTHVYEEWYEINEWKYSKFSPLFTLIESKVFTIQ